MEGMSGLEIETSPRGVCAHELLRSTTLLLD